MRAWPEAETHWRVCASRRTTRPVKNHPSIGEPAMTTRWWSRRKRSCSRMARSGPAGPPGRLSQVCSSRTARCPWSPARSTSPSPSASPASPMIAACASSSRERGTACAGLRSLNQTALAPKTTLCCTSHRSPRSPICRSRTLAVDKQPSAPPSHRPDHWTRAKWRRYRASSRASRSICAKGNSFKPNNYKSRYFRRTGTRRRVERD